MLNLTIKKAFEVCGIKNRHIEIEPCNDKNLVLFNFDGSKENLSQYLYLLFETNCVLLLNPINRKNYDPSFHGLFPFERVIGQPDNFPTHNPTQSGKMIERLIQNKIRLIIPTSGTTSTPKLVCFSEEKIENAAKNISKSLFLDSTSMAFGYLPLCFSFGLSVLHSHLYSQGKFYLPNTDRPFLEGFTNTDCTHFYCVPSMLSYLHRFSDKCLKLSDCQMLAQAGGAISEKESQFWFTRCGEYDIKFVKMYGQTECGPRVSALHSNKKKIAYASVGAAISGVDITIQNKTNEIFVTSNSLADAILQLHEGKWRFNKPMRPFPTGDLGYLKQGQLYITGRLSRLIKIQDIRYSLDELEQAVEQELEFDVALIGSTNSITVVPSQPLEDSSLRVLKHKFGIANRHIKVMSSSIFTLSSNLKKDYATMEKLVNG